LQTIPVDVARLGRAIVVVPPERKINQETGEVRTDRDGNPVWTVGVAVRQRQGRRASVIEVSVPAEPRGLIEGGPVSLVDLEAYSWSMGDRSGISFRAAAILPATAGAAPAAAAAASAGKSSGGEGR
jgi:hypothetical protein